MTPREELENLANLQQGITPQSRGRKFEEWLNRLLDKEGMAPRTSFRPAGEEVDGSFLHEGRFYLLEAKWWMGKVPASAVYQFKGKVDGKLVGTIGVFISMSEYGPDAVDALRVGKELNIILFDRDDVFAAATDGFSEVLRHKLRLAAELGEVFVPYAATNPPVPLTPSTNKPLAVVTEGQRDEFFIRGLAQNLLNRGIKTRELEVFHSHGIVGLANVALAATEAGRHVLIFVDFEGDRQNIPDDLMYVEGRTQGVLVGPWSTKWMGLPSTRGAKKLRRDEIFTRAAEINVEHLQKRDGHFERLVRILSE
ncbi:restriction endonuclease [Streptomyces sp. NBC_00452]|uniref:restriction endonuclease n=1 Tax=Streptomyces sp. NBC_00452 TaxID=2975746 RepID=UPI00225A7AD6|nr:restriction endonuclease [Streptomyces sp. NBC_00452]MCX5060371.1 restriction endonuclease [Streptomyces sp. NBC_00452]